MSFFDTPPPPPREEELVRRPPWLAPPANVLPGAATFALLLVNTGEVAVAVTGGLASPAGLEFTVQIRRRRPVPHRRFGHSFFDPDIWDEHGRVRDEVLRFGVAFADGRRASNLPLGHDLHDPGGQPQIPVLNARGGGGSDEFWVQDQWLWPLPPPGPLAFVCAWPSEGIAETRAEIDAAAIAAAAARAVVLWPDEAA